MNDATSNPFFSLSTPLPLRPRLSPQVDAVFTFSGGRIKPANRQYSSIKNDYEVTFNMNITVHSTYSISQCLFIRGVRACSRSSFNSSFN